jgi:hypoxanthine phosphoribosyltransferase
VIRRLLTEEELLAQSINENSSADPEWDREARIAACVAGIKEGADTSVLRQIFGAEIVEKCMGHSDAKSGPRAAAENKDVIKAIEDSTNSLETKLKDFDDVLAAVFNNVRSSLETGGVRRKTFLALLRNVLEWRRQQFRSILEDQIDAKQLFDRVEVLLSATDTASSIVAERIASEAAQGLNHPLLAPGRSNLTWTGMVDSLARLQNAVAAYKPDLIVAGNPSGSAVADLLTFNSSLSGIPVASFDGHVETAIRWKSPIGQFGRPKIVAIVGDLAISGKTLVHVIKFVREHFPAAKVYCGVLATSSQALRETSAVCHLLYHQVTAVGVPGLEYGRLIGVQRTDDCFFLLTHSGARIPIPMEGLRLTRKDFEARVPREPIPWIMDDITLAP